MPKQFMRGRLRIHPLVILSLDRFTIGLPYRAISLSAIDCTFTEYYKDGVTWHPHAEDAVLKGTYKEFQRALEQHLKDRPNTKPCKFEQGNCWRHTYRVIDADKRTACFVILGNTWGTPYVHIQFNPSKMTPAGVKAFHELLDEVFVDGYCSLYHHGVLSHVELAADYSASFGDRMLMYLGKKIVWTQMGSIYVGRNRGPTQGRLYNRASKSAKAKGKAQKAKAMPAPCCTRWETVITRTDETLRAFVEKPTECPLAGFRLLPLGEMKGMLAGAKLDPELADHIRVLGQRKVLTPAGWKLIEALLENSPYEWGRPTKLWPHFRSLLRGLEPLGISDGPSKPAVVCPMWNCASVVA